MSVSMLTPRLIYGSTITDTANVAVLEDMEATEKMIEELLDAVKGMEVPEEY